VPRASRHLSVGDVHDAVRTWCFTPDDPCPVGVELEWLTYADDDDRDDNGGGRDPEARVDAGVLATELDAAGPLPARSAVTFEPGGQLELSSRPCPTAAAACAGAAADLGAARRVVAAAGVRLVGVGSDPLRTPARVVASPRYEAMEAYFDAQGPAGRRMMCNTASVQVNVGLGPTAADASRQWRLASRLGPTLAAAFAHSPLAGGRPTGFRSTRLATWLAMDRTRTAPVDRSGGSDGAGAWTEYALDARVMLIRSPGGGCVPVTTPLTFRQWMAEGHEQGGPDHDDLEYHLSTLFPPVRPRGGPDAGTGSWLELRVVDALPDPWWQVPVALVAVLLGDAAAGAAAERAVAGAGAAGCWTDAARTALASPALAASARGCFDAALAALARTPDAGNLTELVAAYAERWVEPGRCPADDLLDSWAGGGSPLPDTQEVGAWT
jgi:glutamate--cysteine ligase